jgi:serine protease
MGTIKRNLVITLVSLIVLGLSGMSFGAGELFENSEVKTIGGGKWAPGEIIVKFRRGVSQDVIRGINQRHGTSALSMSKRGKFMRLRIPRNRSVDEMLDIYSRNPNVEYAEPNFIASALMTPNDPYYSYQWHLDNGVYGGINMESAWDIETGDPGVIVAVIDTGVAYENYGRYNRAPDLANTSFVPGYDFMNDDSHPNDDNGHGTHVTGTIAQWTNNSLGVAGVAFNTRIMPIKVLDDDGYGTVAVIADGIYFGADNGAHVINLSLGTIFPSLTLENAVAYAYNKDVTIVCAAGNEYPWNFPVYPAAYDAYCIAVGATRYDETRAYYSNTGSYIDIAAPGGDLDWDQNYDGYGDGVLQQTFNPNTKNPSDFGYWFFQGTSMASPHAAGVAALLISHGVTGPDNVRVALQETAEDKGPAGWDPEYGWGIVDAHAALIYSPDPVHDVAVTGISAPSWCLQGDIVSVVVSVANQGDSEETFTVTLNDTTDTDVIGSQSVTLPANGTRDLTFYWDTAGASISDHVLLAQASAVTGETDTDDNSEETTVTVKEPVHDVAVIAIDAPFEAYQGDLVTISVTVENQGTYPETTPVSLTDTTDNKPIGSQSVTLNAGDLTIVSFEWDTAGASLGDHILKAEASVVSGEMDTGDNSMTTATTIKGIPSGPAIYVSNITIELQKKGPNYQARAYVTIVGESGPIIKEATVTGDWTLNGSYLNTASNDTRGRGSAVLDSNKLKAQSGDSFTITVTDVAKDGYTYDPDSNIKTSDSVTVP